MTRGIESKEGKGERRVVSIICGIKKEEESEEEKLKEEEEDYKRQEKKKEEGKVEGETPAAGTYVKATRERKLRERKLEDKD